MPTHTQLCRGDVVLVPFPFADLSGHKVRPAAIVSADPQQSEVIVAFITSVMTNRSPRGAEVALLAVDPDFLQAGLKVNSLLRLDKLVTLSSSIITRRLGHLGASQSQKIESMLRKTFALK